MENTKIDFTGQTLYIGIDVHKTQWSLAVYWSGGKLKNTVTGSSPEEVNSFLRRNYPGAEYHSVYEAGFSGFSAHRRLNELGIKNIVINPADVPTNHKERITKNDRNDANKLAVNLMKGNLKAIYVLDRRAEAIRTLCRDRYTLTGDITREKNRIKTFLNFKGIKMADGDKWSCKFIARLKQMSFEYKQEKQVLSRHIEKLEDLLRKRREVEKEIEEAIKEGGNEALLNRLRKSVPGIGKITAYYLMCEIVEMKRFKNIETLSAFVGLIPIMKESGEKKKKSGITGRKNKYLRYYLIEAAWIAVRRDPAMSAYYMKLCKRMKKTRAIVSVARKLLNRVRHIWLKEEDYQEGIK
ncbi:MAG: IS110 family transposase [Ignavibacteriaceae bacterium]|nr:IS110 family transposase [Ignavibacteriaceae bacterium]